MSISEGRKKSNRKWPPDWAWTLPLLIGLFQLSRVMQSPAIRIVSLDARYPTHYIRCCVGVALTLLMITLVRPHMPDANLDRSAELEATRKIKQSP